MGIGVIADVYTRLASTGEGIGTADMGIEPPEYVQTC